MVAEPFFSMTAGSGSGSGAATLLPLPGGINAADLAVEHACLKVVLK